MEINFKKNFYLYGELSGNYNSEIDEKDYFVIYTKPQIFDDVSLSSLEGFFVQEPGLGGGKDLTYLDSKIYFNREKMSEFEKEHNGKFIPFKN